VGPRGGLDAVVKTKIPSPLRGHENCTGTNKLFTSYIAPVFNACNYVHFTSNFYVHL
jgi:hypothetical protein